MLRTLADQLQRNVPGAAKSLLEGLEDTVTAQELHLPMELRQSSCNTNIIENVNNGVRHHSGNVKRRHGGEYAER